MGVPAPLLAALQRKIRTQPNLNKPNIMTKKHFIALANHIKANPETYTVTTVHALADFCQSQNPNFNRQLWIAYIGGICGPNGGAVKK